ncbi:MAG TPA: DUF1579 domain-containing protein [Oculatellaceae cyanobacterium]|jgi:hypothetical protein
MTFPKLFASKTVHALCAVAATLALSSGVALAEEKKPCPVDFPKPNAQHAWLQQFVGEWDSDVELMEPGSNTPIKKKGSESVRAVGGFWIISESKGDMMGTPFTGVQTLGYDTVKQKYVGTWVDSMTDYMWQYEGSVDPTGKILTLDSEGCCPMKPGETIKAKDVIEVQDKNHKVFKSFMLGPDGQWHQVMTVRATRKQ